MNRKIDDRLSTYLTEWGEEFVRGVKSVLTFEISWIRKDGQKKLNTDRTDWGNKEQIKAARNLLLCDLDQKARTMLLRVIRDKKLQRAMIDHVLTGHST